MAKSSWVGHNVLAEIATFERTVTGDAPVARIPAHMDFPSWCESIAKDRMDLRTGRMLRGLRVDGVPFSLADRPAMKWIYACMPSTPAEAFGQMVVLRKCSQVGFTVLELLYSIYVALKWEGVRFGFYLPGAELARGKSTERFMPIARTIPEAYELLTAPAPDALTQRRSEGHVMMRRMGESLFHFLWTTGTATTESYPMDVISFDEVQEMAIADMEKTLERLSASKIRFVLMGSTANWPEDDIDHWYKRGSQWRFHTRCPTCAVEEPLDDYFPQCIKFDPTAPDRVTGIAGDYRYVCRDGHWIDDSQIGAWKPDNPDADLRRLKSIHFHQMLSPTISPRQMYEAYTNATDMKNFFNRKLGKPYQDPNQIPVTLEHLHACAAEGMRRGLEWKSRAKDTFMGIDQMGAFNVVIIKERLPDGCQAVVHVEVIYDENPFARCDELMELYGVRVCVVEQLPNFNDAMRFANRHPRRVFLCNGYSELQDDVMRWGDSPSLDANQRRTDEDERTRFTVTVDQYKAMSLSLARLVKTKCLFPDPQGRVQEVRRNEARVTMPVLQDYVFPHFTKVALITERTEGGKLRRRVEKVGTDPHAAYANMLCDVAWARAHGTATFILSEPSPAHPTTPEQHPVIQQIRHRQTKGACGGCENFKLKEGEAGEAGYGICAFRSTASAAVGVQDILPAGDCSGYTATGH